MASQRPPEPDEQEATASEQETGKSGQLAAPTDQFEVSLSAGRALALVVAVGAVLGGAAILFDPSLVAPSDFTVVLVLGAGGVAVFFGGQTLFRQMRSDDAAVDPPLVEYRSATTVPGEDVDAASLGTDPEGAMGSYKQRRTAKARLRKLVLGTLERTGVRDPDDDTRLSDVDWTDDPLAASLFDLGTPFSRTDRFRMRFERVGVFGRQVGAVVDEVARTLSLSDRDWTDPDEVGDVGVLEEGWFGTTADVTCRDRDLSRWQVAVGLALLAVGIGAIVRAPALVLSATVAAGMAVYGYVSEAPAPRLAIERQIDTDNPDPGESVTVTVTVENTGSGALFDLRLFDGVPGSLATDAGTPRHSSALRPGASTTLQYTVTADRGTHTFDPVLVVARPTSGAVERTATVTAGGDDRIVCQPKPTQELEVPVRAKTTRDVGRIPTDTGGSGIEFHSVREYRNGDPLNRIDWNRAARGDGLATLQFNVERSATVVLVVDARPAAYTARDHDSPSAVERSLGAASEVFVGLLDSDDRVGLASLGPDQRWLPPGAGTGHWALAREMLTDPEAFGHPGREESFYPALAMRRLRKQLPRDAQLIVFSPICDDTGVEICRRLHAYGYATTVLSPETTGTESPGRTAAHVERRFRLSRLREADVRVIDWEPKEPLRAAIDRADRRWSG